MHTVEHKNSLVKKNSDRVNSRQMRSWVGGAERRIGFYCTPTPEEFRAYWKDARPIFEVESHDYSFGSCYFKTVENGKEYEIGIGGTGTITKDDTTYYYVRKGDMPDFADMPPAKTTLTQDIQAIIHLIKYVLSNGIK